MINQNNFWASNLKFLRTRKKLNQNDLANKLGIKRSKLNVHENGQTKNPPVEDLIKFSNFFRMSIDTLLKVDISSLSELKIRELEAGNDLYVSGKNIRILATTINPQTGKMWNLSLLRQRPDIVQDLLIRSI